MNCMDQGNNSLSHKIFTPNPVYPQVLMNSVNSPFMNFCISNLLDNEDFTNLMSFINGVLKKGDSSIDLKKTKIKNENSNNTINTSKTSHSKFIAYYPNFNEKLQIYKRCREISDSFVNIYFAPQNSSLPQSKTKINESISKIIPDSSLDLRKDNTRDKVKCNCSKNNCLKQYCECLKAGQTCEGCNCLDCKNTECFQDERKIILDKIFLRKVKSLNYIEHEAKKTAYCTCKKSSCQKKYCECYLKNEKCNEQCKCKNCLNVSSKRKKAEIELTLPTNLELINIDNSLIIQSSIS